MSSTGRHARPPTAYRNRILPALPKNEIAPLAPHLSPITLKVRRPLLDVRAQHAHFLEEGLVSMVLTLADGAGLEWQLPAPLVTPISFLPQFLWGRREGAVVE